MNDFGKTLIMTGGGIGDVLYLTAFLKAIARHTSDGKVSVACKRAEAITDIYKHEDWLGQSVSLKNIGKVKGFRGLMKLLKAEGFDTVINFHHSLTFQLLPFFAGIKNRYGFLPQDAHPFSKFLINRPLSLTKEQYRSPAYDERWSQSLLVMRINRVMDALGLDYKFLPKEISYPETRDEKIRALPRPFTAIGINCSSDGRQWGGRNYAELINVLNNKYGGTFVLFGGPDVLSHAETIVNAKYDKPVSFINMPEMKAGLESDMEILSMCNKYIGNDSFGANVSAIMGLETYIIFMNEVILRYSPSIRPVILPEGDFDFSNNRKLFDVI